VGPRERELVRGRSQKGRRDPRGVCAGAAGCRRSVGFATRRREGESG
jgi:hypothetical protein